MTKNFPKMLASSVVVVFLLSKAFDNKNTIEIGNASDSNNFFDFCDDI